MSDGISYIDVERVVEVFRGSGIGFNSLDADYVVQHFNELLHPHGGAVKDIVLSKHTFGSQRTSTSFKITLTVPVDVDYDVFTRITHLGSFYMDDEAMGWADEDEFDSRRLDSRTTWVRDGLDARISVVPCDAGWQRLVGMR